MLDASLNIGGDLDILEPDLLYSPDQLLRDSDISKSIEPLDCFEAYSCSTTRDDDDEVDRVLEKLISEPEEHYEVEKRRRIVEKEDQHHHVVSASPRHDGVVCADQVHSRLEESASPHLIDCDSEFDEDGEDLGGADDTSVDDDDDIDTVPLSDGAIPHPSYNLTESLVAQKMSKLSMQQREEVYHDIHGVHDAIDEDAEDGFVDRKLQEMADELLKIESVERQAYELARTKNRRYVDDRDFRLRFLRADRFDPKLAAKRYAQHYETKLELFGEDKLGRDILQDDLGDEALHNLYSGMNQILPQRDNAGRLVWVWIAAAQEQAYSDEAVLRRTFYNNMMISEDIETQKKGSVGVFYTLNHEQTRRGAKGSNNLRRIAGLAKGLPMPIVAIHFCYNSYAWLPVLSVAQLAVHLFIRLRIRGHFGTHDECLYKLQTFGIPAHTLPIEEDGSFNGDNHKKFLERRRKQEREWQAKMNARDKKTNSKDSNSKNKSDQNKDDTPFVGDNSKISVPARFDVLLGRGRGYFNHVGNIRYRAMIEEFKEKYDSSTNKEKKAIVADIIASIHDRGGRFLKDDDGTWVPIDNKATRQKVGHSFRALREARPNREAEKGGSAPSAKRMSRD